jgi:hypothetical protein
VLPGHGLKMASASRPVEASGDPCEMCLQPLGLHRLGADMHVAMLLKQLQFNE